MAERRVNEDEIIELIDAYYRLRQPPPTVREIADYLGVARSTAEHHLRKMIERGVLVRTPGVARGISVAKMETYDA